MSRRDAERAADFGRDRERRLPERLRPHWRRVEETCSIDAVQAGDLEDLAGRFPVRGRPSLPPTPIDAVAKVAPFAPRTRDQLAAVSTDAAPTCCMNRRRERLLFRMADPK
ncbi:MAG: hypothetical protein U0792_20165 [Gemmataceae bacterium]